MQISSGNVKAIAQIVAAIKDGVEKLDNAYESKNSERVGELKKELLKLNQYLESLLK